MNPKIALQATGVLLIAAVITAALCEAPMSTEAIHRRPHGSSSRRESMAAFLDDPDVDFSAANVVDGDLYFGYSLGNNNEGLRRDGVPRQRLKLADDEDTWARTDGQKVGEVRNDWSSLRDSPAEGDKQPSGISDDKSRSSPERASTSSSEEPQIKGTVEGSQNNQASSSDTSSAASSSSLSSSGHSPEAAAEHFVRVSRQLAGASMQFVHRPRQYDVPQIECPPAADGFDRFSCPSPDRLSRYICLDAHQLCDGFIDCPHAEDEDRMACMFYKTTKAHLDVLADALLRWARGR